MKYPRPSSAAKGINLKIQTIRPATMFKIKLIEIINPSLIYFINSENGDLTVLPDNFFSITET